MRPELNSNSNTVLYAQTTECIDSGSNARTSAPKSGANVNSNNNNVGAGNDNNNNDQGIDSDWELIDPEIKNRILGEDVGYYKTSTGLELEFDLTNDVIIKYNKKTGEYLIENAENLVVTGSEVNDLLTIKNSTIKKINTKGGDDKVEIYDSTMEDKLWDNFDMGKGDDTLVINNSKIDEKINLGEGNDNIIVTNSTISDLMGQAGNDTIKIEASTVTETIKGGDGSDYITISGGSVVYKTEGGNGTDYITICGGSDLSSIIGGSGDDKITVDDAAVAAIEGNDGDDEIKVNNSYVNVEIRTGSGNDEVSINNSTIGDIYTERGEDKVDVEKSTIGTIETGKDNDVLHVTDSEVAKDIILGSGDDCGTVTGSKVGKIYMDNGNDDLALVDTTITEIEGGDGNDKVGLDNTNVIDTIYLGNGNDILDVKNGSVNGVDQGGGQNKVLMAPNSDSGLPINKGKKGSFVIEMMDPLPLALEGPDTVYAEQAVSATNQITSKYTDTDRELTSTEQYYALTINMLSNQLESIRAQFESQQNADGVVGDSYNVVKAMLDMGVTSDEIQAAIEQQEAMILELQEALNSEDSSKFEEVFKKWTGVEYNEENVAEFLGYQQLYTFAVAGEKVVEDFSQKIAQAQNIEEVFNLYIDFYGSEDVAREKLNQDLGGTNFYDDSNRCNYYNIKINENNQVEYSYCSSDESDPLDSGNKNCQLNEIPNVFITDINMQKLHKGLLDEYETNFENTMGYSIETLQAKYATSQVLAMGTNNSFQKLIDEYCIEQSTIEDRIAAGVQIAGMGLMAVGGLLTFVCPPVGATVMNVGKWTSVVGMFADDGLEALDSWTSENGLTEEHAREIVKEVVIDAALYLSGLAINVVAEGAHTGAAALMESIGGSEALQTLIGWTAEVGTDTVLSLMSDLVLTGEVDLTSEGISQLLGIISGIAGAKVKEYNEYNGKGNHRGKSDSAYKPGDTPEDTKLNADDSSVIRPNDDQSVTRSNTDNPDTATSDISARIHEMRSRGVTDDALLDTVKNLSDPQYKMTKLLMDTGFSDEQSIKISNESSDVQTSRLIDLVENNGTDVLDALNLTNLSSNLNDAQFNVATLLFGRNFGLDSAIKTASNFSEVECESVLKLIDEGYDIDFIYAVKGDINNIGLQNGNGINLCEVPKLETYWDRINIAKTGERLDPTLADWKIKVGDNEVSILTDNNMVTKEYLDAHKSDLDMGKHGIVLTDDYKQAVENALARMQAAGQKIPDKIYLTDLFVPDSRIQGRAAGYFGNLNPDSIFLRSSVFSSEEFLTRSICHEAAHMADYDVSTNRLRSNSQGTIIQPDKDTIEFGDITLRKSEITDLISDYAITNNQEFVAEVTTLISSGTIRVDNNGKYTIITDEHGFYLDAHMYKKTYMPEFGDSDSINAIMKLYMAMTNGGLAKVLPV